MAGMSVLDYAMMVEDTHVTTQIIEYRERDIDSGVSGRGSGPLIGVVLFDTLRDGYSMVYSFFEPSEIKRSLGTFFILDHIERTRKAGLPYCHLGYWVTESQKMAYKSRFLPQQRLLSGGWTEFRK